MPLPAGRSEAIRAFSRNCSICSRVKSFAVTCFAPATGGAGGCVPTGYRGPVAGAMGWVAGLCCGACATAIAQASIATGKKIRTCLILSLHHVRRRWVTNLSYVAELQHGLDNLRIT